MSWRSALNVKVMVTLFGYFPFFFACTFLPFSSVLYYLGQVACPTIPKEHLLFGRLVSSWFLLGFSSMCWVRTMCGWVLPLPWTWPMGSIPCSVLTIPTHKISLCIPHIFFSQVATYAYTSNNNMQVLENI